MINAFIGYDPREWKAYNTCVSSIMRRKQDETAVHPIDDRYLRQIGLYNRPYSVTEAGQYIDKRDGKPFSTMFSFTRFLVPHLAKRFGIKDKWVLFADCDFIFLRPLEELFELVDDKFALMCVKHNHTVENEKPKMDGVIQSDYSCKNWSSLMLWNLHHEAHSALTDVHVNYSPGGALHRFAWLTERYLIGNIPETWNWLSGVSPTTGCGQVLQPAAIHYTEGGPWFDGQERCAFSMEWYNEHDQGVADQHLRFAV